MKTQPRRSRPGHRRPAPAPRRSLQQLRAAIDALDRRLVPLLAARTDLVRRVVRFKSTRAAVRAPQRAARVVANARRLARRHAMDPALAARIYRAMIAAFVDFEMVELARRRARRRPR